MPEQEKTVTPRKRRGPKPTGKGKPVVVRIQPEMLAALDKFVDEQSGITRPEAIRLILKDWLIGNQMLPAEPSEQAAVERARHDLDD